MIVMALMIMVMVFMIFMIFMIVSGIWKSQNIVKFTTPEIFVSFIQSTPLNYICTYLNRDYGDVDGRVDVLQHCHDEAL